MLIFNIIVFINKFIKNSKKLIDFQIKIENSKNSQSFKNLIKFNKFIYNSFI